MKSLIASLILATTQATTLDQLRPLELRSNTDVPSKPGFTKTFLDTFSGEPKSLPSSSNWIFDIGTQYPGGSPNWGNNEWETYTDSTSNIHINTDNQLAIIPRLASDGTWTSARIETQRSDFQALEGGKLYIESRIKLGTAPKVKQQGIWPAFWALGSDFRGNYTNWPHASEWDFLEAVSGGDLMYSTVHCGYAPGGPCKEYDGLGNGGVSFSRGVWHTVGFMVDRSMTGDDKNETWESETLNWYLDGENVFKINGSTIADEATWDILAHGPKFLLLNIAVGGNWPGAPNNETSDGRSVGMEVDYVGVWNSM